MGGRNGKEYPRKETNPPPRASPRWRGTEAKLRVLLPLVSKLRPTQLAPYAGSRPTCRAGFTPVALTY